MSDLVGNPEDRFSCIAAHIIEGDLCPDMTIAVDWNTKQ